jgi:hypothetical protein
VERAGRTFNLISSLPAEGSDNIGCSAIAGSSVVLGRRSHDG